MTRVELVVSAFGMGRCCLCKGKKEREVLECHLPEHEQPQLYCENHLMAVLRFKAQAGRKDVPLFESRLGNGA